MARLVYSKRLMLTALVVLLAIVALVTLTSPVSNIMMGLIFFVLLLVFLISSGYLIISLGGRSPGRLAKQRVTIISTFAVLALMFLSVQSLNLASGLTLLLLAIGMLFYSSRRN